MWKIKSIWAENYGWLSAMAVSGAGYLSLSWLKASGLVNESQGSAPLWAWAPLAITTLSALVAFILLFSSKSYIARLMKVFIKIAFLLVVFYSFFGSLLVEAIF